MALLYSAAIRGTLKPLGEIAATEESIMELLFRPRKSVEPRLSNLCAQCGEPIFIPEWSEYLSPRRVRHLWECEACGYRFETTVSFSKQSRS
jgi:hypothetical protein